MENDHFGEAVEYPTILADEINLDSLKEQKDIRSLFSRSPVKNVGHIQPWNGENR